MQKCKDCSGTGKLPKFEDEIIDHLIILLRIL